MSAVERALAPRDRVVVTGASGFIARHLVARLRREELDVVALSRSDGFSLLEHELPLAGVRHVFHVAGVTGVAGAWDSASTFHAVNATGTVRVLEQAARAACSVTHVGGYVYGVPSRLPIDEGHAVVPNNPYALSKYQAELACEFFGREYGVPVTSIRLFNVYGPGQGEGFVIGRIVRQIVDGSAASIRLATLEPRRDYLYVDDAVDALVRALPSAGCTVLNVGSGTSVAVGEIVQCAQRIAGTQKPVEVTGERRRGEVMDVVADVSRIRRYCGWEPRTSLEAGLSQTLEAAR